MTEKIKKKANKLPAWEYALYLLSLRLRTAGDLEQKMARKGYTPVEITEVIQRLTDLQFLNDEQFAQIYFDNLLKYKLFGYYGIKKKLIEKKIAPALVERLLRGFSPAAELAIARKLLGRGRGKSRQQQVRQLSGKGFRGDVIFKAVGVNPQADLD